MKRAPSLPSHNGSTTSLLQQRGRAPRDGSPSTSAMRARDSSNPPASLSDKFSLSASPAAWGMPLLMDEKEPDDFLHNPDPRRDKKNDAGGTIFTVRGLANLGCLFILVLGVVMLFAGYPLLSHFMEEKPSNQGGFNIGGINASGQIPELPGNFGLIDKDTPAEALTIKSYMSDEELQLVFSDEFNLDGRSFYPGDDPFWEAVDLHYWQTDNQEWYDPAQATTRDGYLELTIDEVKDISQNHNMTYKSSMLQTWNKFCFTGGLILASVQLPGSSDVAGFWPAVWTMGNLGRAGYGASTDGLWPYSYEACDVGTLPNQTYPGEMRPNAAVEGGDREVGGILSYLSGQRLSACTCPGESHPGPMRRDGSYVGRSAPEIDVLETTVTDGVGHISMSAQIAPFNAKYFYPRNAQTQTFYDDTTKPNSYLGGRYQQCASGLALTNPDCYESPGLCYETYGFEYKPGFDDGYITWIQGKPTWTVHAAAFGPDGETEIGPRPIAQEPMYVIVNLGISEGFGDIEVEKLIFPAKMRVDWIRIYQPKDRINIGCDPEGYPTSSYIKTYPELYADYNMTSWAMYDQPWPKNKMSGC